MRNIRGETPLWIEEEYIAPLGTFVVLAVVANGMRNMNFPGTLSKGLGRGAWVITWTLCML
jgi:hypothetical protein